MAASGSGTGTRVQTGPVGAPSIFHGWPTSVVTLSRYARIIGYAEPAFFGVVHEDNRKYACREIWTKNQRDLVARYLYEAQVDIEETAGFPLQPTWVVDDRPPTTTGVMLAKHTNLIQVGARAEATVQADAEVNHATDPATVGPIATTATDPAEIKVFYPGTEQEIEPAKVSISGGAVTIWIPRVRMVASSALDNPATGLDYADLDNFLASVDVKRVYNDPTVGAQLVWRTDSMTASSMSETAAALTITNKEIGEVFVHPTEQPVIGAGNLTLARVQLHYQAGLETLTQKAEDAIVRLAHAKLPAEPCGCDGVRLVWKRDATIPQVISRERLNCPYGLPDGAWVAYQFALSMMVYRMGIWR